MTVAFDIRYPWRRLSRAQRARERSEFFRDYRETVITVWHVDPERRGNDDSCGWFKRAWHGDPVVLAKIEKWFEQEWDSEHLGHFDAVTGQPRLSLQAMMLAFFHRAAWAHYGESWSRTNRFMRRHLYDILSFAENRSDSMKESLTMKYGVEKREDRIRHFASVIYGCILRWERPWYRHPRWHVWHWKLQVHPLQNFKRWAFSRCAGCRRGFAWGYSPVSTSWNGTGPRWFRDEKNIYHSQCQRSIPTPQQVMKDRGGAINRDMIT